MNIFRSARQRRPTLRLGSELGEWMEAQWAPPASDTCSYRFLALQPIFDRKRKIFGYEALSRSSWDNRFTGNSDSATQTMIEEWMPHGLTSLNGGSRTFLNCTREILVRDWWKRFPTSTVPELLETIEPDKEVLIACSRMKDMGYKIALDDFQLSGKMEPLIELSDFVKVDFRASGKEERAEILRRLKRCSSIPVAEKIETREEFEFALEEGFKLFQGYYLARPTVFSRRHPHTNGDNHLRPVEVPR